MNANATTSAPTIVKLAQSVGNAAAYALWAGFVLIVFGLFVIALNLESPAIGVISQTFVGIVAASMLAIGLMAGSAKILKAYGAF